MAGVVELPKASYDLGISLHYSYLSNTILALIKCWGPLSLQYCKRSHLISPHLMVLNMLRRLRRSEHGVSWICYQFWRRTVPVNQNIADQG
jgi:hypothetical protein